MKDEIEKDELTPLVDAVADGKNVDWKHETREFDAQQMRTADGLQQIEAIARAHRTLLGSNDDGSESRGDSEI